MSFSCPWGKIMLYSVVCFQVDLTPEKYSLVHYVSAIVEQTGRAWAWDVASGHMLPDPFQGGHCLWRSGQVLGDVMMIVSAKESSVTPWLRKRYVFSYSALSEIWIGNAWLRRSSLGSLLCAGQQDLPATAETEMPPAIPIMLLRAHIRWNCFARGWE